MDPEAFIASVWATDEPETKPGTLPLPMLIDGVFPSPSDEKTPSRSAALKIPRSANVFTPWKPRPSEPPVKLKVAKRKRDPPSLAEQAERKRLSRIRHREGDIERRARVKQHMEELDGLISAASSRFNLEFPDDGVTKRVTRNGISHLVLEDVLVKSIAVMDYLMAKADRKD